MPATYDENKIVNNSIFKKKKKKCTSADMWTQTASNSIHVAMNKK